MTSSPSPSLSSPSPSPILDKDFDRFWGVYPRKVGKGAARKAWDAAMRIHTSPQVIIDGAVAYGNDPNRQLKFTKHPATWLRAECWLDEMAPPDSGEVGTFE